MTSDVDELHETAEARRRERILRDPATFIACNPDGPTPTDMDAKRAARGDWYGSWTPTRAAFERAASRIRHAGRKFRHWRLMLLNRQYRDEVRAWARFNRGIGPDPLACSMPVDIDGDGM